jgi:hypothetical protein
VPGRVFRRSSTPLRGCSKSASRGWGLRRKTSKLYEGYGLSSRARPQQPSKSRRRGRLRLRRSRPSSRARRLRTPLQTAPTSTSGKLSGISLCSRVKSPARCHSSKSSLRRSLQHQRPLRRPRRHLNSTSGTPCRPCKLSWTSGGSRRMRPKGRASIIARNAGKRRNTLRQMTPRSATLYRFPCSRSSSRARHGPIVSTLTPCLSMLEITTPRNSL